MNCAIIKKAKIFFISVLVVLVVGLTLFGIFGFNQTVDYKNSYELQVTVNHKASNVLEVMNDATEAYFSENNIKPLNFATQTYDDGMSVIYKFNNDVTTSAQGLKVAIQTALDNKATAENVTADVAVRAVHTKSNANVGKIILALAVAIVAIFVYTVIFEKLASALSVVFSTILAALLFLSIMGFTRIPASPFVAVSAMIAVVLAGIIAIATVNRYKAELKKADKLAKYEIVDKVANNSKKLYVIIASAMLLIAVALCVLGMPYLMIASAQIVIAAVSGITAAIFGTPVMWCLIKKKK